MLTKDSLLTKAGSFSWNFSQEFFIETSEGNFVWSDPGYDGDNTMTLYKGSIKKYCKESKIPYVRDKGVHILADYCGTDFTLVIPE